MANNLIVCGGTFDHFHKGHEEFLNYALSLGGKIMVGLTSDEYIKNLKVNAKRADLIELYEIRKKSLEDFLMRKRVQDRISIIKINDSFGPTISKDLQIDAIVASSDTKKGAEIINQKRKELGLSPLRVLVAPSVMAEDGKLISSARIRNGEISREGKLYVKPSWLQTDLFLPEELRGELQKPFGEFMLYGSDLSNKEDNLIITVGDVTTKAFNERSLKHNLSVIDFKVEREQRFFNVKDLGFSKHENIIRADNPAGFITKDLFRKLSEIFTKNIDGIILQVNGEEDLAVLPLILLSPLNTIIYYGQPHEGLVQVKVSEETKNKAYNLVLKLKQV